MKFFSTLILTFSLFPAYLFCQIINKQIVTAGYEDWGAELYPSSDSGYFAFLYESKFVPTTNFLEMVRMDKDGNMLWNQFFVPPVSNGGSTICQLKSGEFFITHIYNSPIGLAPELIKIDTSGNLLWSIQISDTMLTGYITDLCVGHDSSIWLGGSFYSGGLTSYCIIKCDTAGNILNNLRLSPDPIYYIKGISQIVETNTGDLILASYRESTDSAFWDIIKITPAGQILWSYQVPPQFTSSFSRDFMIEKDGGCIFTLSPNNPNSNNVFRLDSLGTLLWQTALLESINGWTCYSLCDSPDSGFYMTGRGNINGSLFSEGVVLCKFNDQGVFLGGEQMPEDTTAYSEVGDEIKILHGNKIVILGGLCRNACNYQDGILIIYDQPFLSSIAAHSNDPEILLFPNPFHDKATLRISNTSSSEMNLKIYNTSGKVIKEFVKKSNPYGLTEITIESKYLSTGLFFFELSQSNQTIYRGKMIIN